MVQQATEAFIGIDVGGTKVLGLLVDPRTGRVLGREQQPTPKSDPNLVPVTIETVAATLIERHGLPPAIGVGVPGLVDRAGVLHYGPNVQGVLQLDIASRLRQRFGIAVVATNDANNAAIAEHRWGAARGADHAIIITQGTGIGGALIVNGALLLGAHGFAGEPGHMLVDPMGHRCACGQLGCWESVASGAGLVNLTRDLIDEGRAEGIVALAGGVEHLRGEHVAEAMRNGDPDAAEVVARFVDWIARGLAGLVNLLDPERIVLGGGLSDIGEYFLDDVGERLTGYVLGGPYRPIVPVVAAQLGPDAGAIGAAANAADLSIAGSMTFVSGGQTKRTP